MHTWLERALAATAGPMPHRVRTTQTGTMWQRPGGRALRFTASQEYALDRVAFAWRARFPVALRVVDELSDGIGCLSVRAGGLPIMRRQGAEIDTGEILRYLAELPWIPHAALLNPELEWRELDARSVEVAVGGGDARQALRLEFDAAGDVARASCDARPRAVGKSVVATPWGGSFADYALLGGVRIPTRAEVAWELPEGSFTYWRGSVDSLQLLAA